jgi:hypothetical protein
MILPDLVLGRSSAQMIRFGRANFPILSPTCPRRSSLSEDCGSASWPSVT